MRELFYTLENFNADISSWDTSRVTDMNYMFCVRSSTHLLIPPRCPSHLAPHRMPLHVLARPTHRVP